MNHLPKTSVDFSTRMTSSPTLAWTPEAWEDYRHWQTQERKTLKRINALIEDILRDDPFDGLGAPEPLKHILAGAWSRRIDDTNRLVYVVSEQYGTIVQAHYHY